ncbi:MAG: hypothetical protein AAFP77_04725 [Bacteroidota bacterium]
MKKNFMLFRTILPFAILSLAIAFSSCEKDTIKQETTVPEAPEQPTLNALNIEVTDGILAFQSLEDFATAMKAISGLSRDEKEAWAQQLNFQSLSARLRSIQDQIDAQPDIPGKTHLTAGEKELFSFEDDGTLVSHGPDLLLSELITPEGLVYIEGALNSFGDDYHAIVKEEPTIAKMNTLLAQAASSPEQEMYFFSRPIRKEIVDYNDLAKESKFFPCPLFDRGVNIWGHRKEENIGGQRQRLRVELSQAIYHFGGTDNRVFSYVSMMIENRKRSGWSWIRTFPDYEYGTLAWLNGGPATSGETSSSSVVQSLRVDRDIRVTLSNGGNQILRTDVNVVPDPTGWSFDISRFGDADEYYLIDNVISRAILSPGVSIVSSGGEYGFSRGKISVNWLNRSSTMDIQLGCQ